MTALREFGEPERLRPLGISVDATGTKYAGRPDHPISYRPEASYQLDWGGLRKEVRSRELEMIGVEILTQDVRKDPNVRYCEAVVEAVLDRIDHRAATSEEIDTIRVALSSAISDAAEVVALAWLRERGSVPLLAHEPPA